LVVKTTTTAPALLPATYISAAIINVPLRTRRAQEVCNCTADCKFFCIQPELTALFVNGCPVLWQQLMAGKLTDAVGKRDFTMEQRTGGRAD